jgi:hypothetical protein
MDEQGRLAAALEEQGWLAAALDEQRKVLDPCAPELVTPHEAEAVKLIIYTAVLCIRLEGKDCPTMGDVVANLETAFALC